MMTVSYYNSGQRVQLEQEQKRAAKKRALIRLTVRSIAAIVFAALLFSAMTFLKGNANGQFVEPPGESERVIVVGAGDTLWEIARTVRQEGQDIRHLIYNIQKRNQLKDTGLQVGQLLIIPET